MRSSEEFEEVKGHSYGVPGYDYRFVYSLTFFPLFSSTGKS